MQVVRMEHKLYTCKITQKLNFPLMLQRISSIFLCNALFMPNVLCVISFFFSQYSKWNFGHDNDAPTYVWNFKSSNTHYPSQIHVTIRSGHPDLLCKSSEIFHRFQSLFFNFPNIFVKSLKIVLLYTTHLWATASGLRNFSYN